MRKKEIWRAVPNTNGMYEVSDLGGVRNLRWGTPRTVAQCNHRQGYKLVNLWVNGAWVTRTVHSLVALAFIGPRPTGLVICHRNDDPADNRRVNIRYDTQKANAADARSNGRIGEHQILRGEAHPNAKLTELEVRSIKARFVAGEGITKVSVAFNRPIGTISSIKRGRTWKHIQ